MKESVAEKEPIACAAVPPRLRPVFELLPELREAWDDPLVVHQREMDRQKRHWGGLSLRAFWLLMAVLVLMPLFVRIPCAGVLLLFVAFYFLAMTGFVEPWSLYRLSSLSPLLRHAVVTRSPSLVDALDSARADWQADWAQVPLDAVRAARLVAVAPLMRPFVIPWRFAALPFAFMLIPYWAFGSFPPAWERLVGLLLAAVVLLASFAPLRTFTLIHACTMSLVEHSLPECCKPAPLRWNLPLAALVWLLASFALVVAFSFAMEYGLQPSILGAYGVVFVVLLASAAAGRARLAHLAAEHFRARRETFLASWDAVRAERLERA